MQCTSTWYKASRHEYSRRSSSSMDEEKQLQPQSSCTQKIKEQALSKNIGGDWIAVYETKARYNAGLYATEYLTRFSKEIHLWGFDSLWSTDVTSQMDNLVTRLRRPPLHEWWRPHWENIFNTYDCEFVIHLPQGESCEFTQDNVRQQHH